jgi:16S rRNA (guanine527-N7)-methyltransferase
VPATGPDLPEVVVEILARAQQEGLVGTGAVVDHVRHSMAFARAVELGRGRPIDAEDRVADLGSGGGLPGLVLAAVWPGASFTLIEGSTRRAAFLRWAVGCLGAGSQVEVEVGRAEEVGRAHRWRASQTVVVARSFGPPAVTAECGAPLLAVGGLLVVSEPPLGEVEGRWPDDGLALLGVCRVTLPDPALRFAVLRATAVCPERYPRRVGVPAKRPLF